MTRSKVEEYKFFGIHTVEQLANASDEVGQKFPGFQDDKRKSNKFLESASASVAEARVLELEKMVKKLQAKIEEDDEEEVPDVLAKQVAAPAHKQEAKMSKTP
jgi:predicted RecB family nuclease